MKITGILLAAGFALRFGEPKLSVTLEDGEQLGLRSARHLKAAIDDCIAVVHEPESEFAQGLKDLGFDIHIQPHPERGMGSSLSLGIEARMHADAWIIMLADMPWIKAETITSVVDSMCQGAAISAPFHDGWRGHPVGISRRFRDDLLDLEGDKGARDILAKHSDLLQHIHVDDPGILYDVDEPGDLTIPH